MTKNTPTPDAFVMTWQESSSIEEVCEKLKINKQQAYQRARNYRMKYEIPLKEFAKKKTRLNIDKLRSLAKQVLSDVE